MYVFAPKQLIHKHGKIKVLLVHGIKYALDFFGYDSRLIRKHAYIVIDLLLCQFGKSYVGHVRCVIANLHKDFIFQNKTLTKFSTITLRRLFGV